MRASTNDWWDISKLPQPKAAIEAGDLQAALSGFATREMLDYRFHGHGNSDVWVSGFGVTLWLMGDTDGAARVWSKASDEALRGKFKYSSTATFQPGLLLWFASVWLKDEDWHDEAAAFLDKLVRKKQPSMGAFFPTLLARFLRKEVHLKEVQAACKSEADRRQALFYGGVRAFEAGDSDQSRQLWVQVEAPTYSQCEFEYYLLAHEIKKAFTFEGEPPR